MLNDDDRSRWLRIIRDFGIPETLRGIAVWLEWEKDPKTIHDTRAPLFRIGRRVNHRDHRPGSASADSCLGAVVSKADDAC